MKPLLLTISIIILTVVAILAFMLSWKLSKHALSRKDTYGKSKFEILGKKISWGIFWSLFAILITSSLLRFIIAFLLK